MKKSKFLIYKIPPKPCIQMETTLFPEKKNMETTLFQEKGSKVHRSKLNIFTVIL